MDELIKVFNNYVSMNSQLVIGKSIVSLKMMEDYLQEGVAGWVFLLDNGVKLKIYSDDERNDFGTVIIEKDGEDVGAFPKIR